MRFYRRKQNSDPVSPPRLVTSNYRKVTSLRQFLVKLKNSKTFNIRLMSYLLGGKYLFTLKFLFHCCF